MISKFNESKQLKGSKLILIIEITKVDDINLMSVFCHFYKKKNYLRTIINSI